MPYDPLQAELPRETRPYPDTYWFATAGDAPPDDGPLETSIDTDVAIIGAGYTGLSCAYYLASVFGMRPVVIEANHPGWGCSGRNGSFARAAFGKLPHRDWVRQWGTERARAFFHESLAALDTVRTLIDTGTIDCDKQPDGWLKVAHRHDMLKALAEERQLFADVFDYPVQWLDGAALQADHFIGEEAYGALRFPDAFGLHPLKFALGLLRMARQAGAAVHAQSPVTGWRTLDGRHQLQTPSGLVRARRVVLATNGYSTERLHPALKHRLLPVLSNIVVTRPMNDDEFAACRLRTTDVITDTRKILNYYRRLPDRRVLLGSRGPILEHSGADSAHRDELLATVRRKFPALKDITVDYHWGGWVALTRDMLPHIHCAEDDASVWYAIGYNGSGVSASVHAGRRLAERLAADTLVPAGLDMPLPRIPLAAFRRTIQRAVFAWYRWQDRR